MLSVEFFFPISAIALRLQQPDGLEEECRTATPAVRVRFPGPANIF